MVVNSEAARAVEGASRLDRPAFKSQPPYLIEKTWANYLALFSFDLTLYGKERLLQRLTITVLAERGTATPN